MQAKQTQHVPVFSSTSPLRYPGGKQRAIARILPYIPFEVNELYSPFFGGGSVELAWAAQHQHGKVHGRDVFQPLVAFWNTLKKDPQGLHKAVIHEWTNGMTKQRFYELQTMLRTGELGEFEQATAFFVINRSSFSGATLSGGMGSGDRFTLSSIHKLLKVDLSNIQIQSSDVFDSLRRRTDRFAGSDKLIYLDPPYWLKVQRLYGDKGDTHDGFNHLRLKRLLDKLNAQGVQWLMSYNDCPEIRELYQDYKQVPKTWKYGMSKNKNGQEVLIFSAALENKHGK
jgi:DNA adenine methylase